MKVYIQSLVISMMLCMQLSFAERAYQVAINRSALHQLKPHPLYVMPVGKQRFITVTTWTSDHYALGQQRLSHNVWVTVSAHMHKRCSLFLKHSLALNIEQLLGMPPLNSYQGWHFVEMRVPVQQANTRHLISGHQDHGMFRPCFSTGSITQSTCHYQAKASHMGQYNAWLLDLASQQYRTKGGYPWTGLGYTYNWNPFAKSIVGMSEFIVTKGTRIDVMVTQSAQQFCGVA